MKTTAKLTKPVKRVCRYQFNDAEKLDIGKELAERSNNLAAIESDKKRIVADFGARIAAEEAQIQSLSTKITSGYEHRDMPCTEHFNVPRAGKKTILRDDNSEQVAVEDMTQDDLQAKLSIDEG